MKRMCTNMKNTVFSGRALSEISFPLGGIGSGSIGLAGNGRLVDWEIFNRVSTPFRIPSISKKPTNRANFMSDSLKPNSLAM